MTTTTKTSHVGSGLSAPPPVRKMTISTGAKDRKKSTMYWDRMKTMVGQDSSSGSAGTSLDRASVVSDMLSIVDFTNMTVRQKLGVEELWDRMKAEGVEQLMAGWMLDAMPETLHLFDDGRERNKDSLLRKWTTAVTVDHVSSTTSTQDKPATVQDRIEAHSTMVVEEINELVDLLHSPEDFRMRVTALRAQHAQFSPPVGEAYFRAWAVDFTAFVSKLVKEPLDSDIMCLWSLFMQLVCLPQEFDKKSDISDPPASRCNKCCCVIL